MSNKPVRLRIFEESRNQFVIQRLDWTRTWVYCDFYGWFDKSPVYYDTYSDAQLKLNNIIKDMEFVPRVVDEVVVTPKSVGFVW